MIHRTFGSGLTAFCTILTYIIRIVYSIHYYTINDV